MTVIQKTRLSFFLALSALVLMTACSQHGPTEIVPVPAEVVSADAEASPGTSRVGAEPTTNVPEAPGWAPVVHYEEFQNYPIQLSDIPRKSAPALAAEKQPKRASNLIEMPISEEEAARLREAAKSLSPNPNIQDIGEALPTKAPSIGTGFPSTDASQCCGGQFTAVPPDPEMAAGPRFLITATNVAFQIFDLAGNVLVPSTTFGSFFAGVPGCSDDFSNFDPNVIYDEKANRFVLGIDDGGVRYCIAATQGPDPTLGWNRYSFPTNVGGNFFDYPHAGVGRTAIFMGANMFGSAGFFEGRLWAVRKRELYAGFPILVVSQSTGGDSTPQPANLHGFHQGTWPTSGPHYILTDDLFNGSTYAVWSWSTPFNGSGGTLVKTGTVNLFAATGVAPGFPVNAPQQGGGALQANDWRVQDAEYRNGSLWMSNTISCNPGGGVVDCVRWAQIDPTGPAVQDAGVFSSPGQFRTFADLAANHCNDMAVGYTRTSSSQFAGVWATGRQSGDPAGTLQPEAMLKAGEQTYTSFATDPPPHRWGDYTGMTIHPNGVGFWYLGEYAKITPAVSKWGTWVNPMRYPCIPPNSVGVYSPASSGFLITNSLSNPSKDIGFNLGAANLQPVYGDWDGNGIRSGGVYDSATGTFQLSNEVTTGGGPFAFAFGTPGAGEFPISGDWNGDGVDTIGVYNPSTGVFNLRDTNAAGPADYTFSIILTTVTANFPPASGDWDGDGRDGVALWDFSTTLWYLKNNPTTGVADQTIQFGKQSNQFKPVGGDWDGDGVDTIGLYYQPQGAFFLKSANVSGNTGFATVRFGNTLTDLPVVK